MTVRRIAPLVISIVVLAACQGAGGGQGGSGGASAPAGSAGAGGSPAAGGGDDYLARIQESGEIVVSTDPEYPPQSYLDPDTNEFVGFDIDVAKEIAERLGVEIRFETPSFSAVTAGSWSNRWDMSVGSVTVTESRKEALDFTQPYYFTPAQLAASEESGITTYEDFAGTTICAGADTTYLDWIEGTLDIAPDAAGEIQTPPEGVQATSLETDIHCAETWRSGRHEFEGWLSSSTTVQGAIDDGFPLVAVGDPVFYEPLAVAFDRTVEDNDSLVAEVDRIVGEMHEDGTLSELSEEWFGEDTTQRD